MGHLVILFYTITLLVGAWAAFTTRQMGRVRPLPCLGPLLRTILFMNLMVFFYQAVEYVLVNLYDGDVTALPAPGLVTFCLAAFCVEAGLAFSVLQTAYGLRLHELPPSVGRVFLWAVLGLTVSYAVGATLLLNGGTDAWLRVTHLAMAGTVMLVVIGTLVALVAHRHRDLARAQARGIRAFGWFYLAGFCALMGDMVLPPAWRAPATALFLLWLNCAPLVWFAVWFDRYASSLPAAVGSPFEELLAKKGVTQREHEVMNLILQGKSNKEIEDHLCISFSTVKNHVYNLYRKLGVNSRTQLMRLTLEDGGLTADQ